MITRKVKMTFVGGLDLIYIHKLCPTLVYTPTLPKHLSLTSQNMAIKCCCFFGRATVSQETVFFFFCVGNYIHLKSYATEFINTCSQKVILQAGYLHLPILRKLNALILIEFVDYSLLTFPSLSKSVIENVIEYEERKYLDPCCMQCRCMISIYI